MAWASRRSARIREQRRITIKAAPTNHTAPTKIAFSAMRSPASPITPNGVAHERCAASDLSSTAPSGAIKLSEVATQIQYFVVALPRQSEDTAQAANQTTDAYSKWNRT